MMVSTNSDPNEDSPERKADAHLDEALEASQENVKNYHIRCAQQLQIVIRGRQQLERSQKE